MGVTKTYNEMKSATDFKKQKCQYIQYYVNKYYDLYRGMWKFGGLDYQQLNYLLAQLWSLGTVWIRKDQISGDPVFCQYAGTAYNWYNQPTRVNLMTTHNAPESVIPRLRLQEVDKDGVMCWIRPNHKGFEADVLSIINRLADCQMAIDINLYLQKFPWLIVTEPENKAELESVVKKILNSEPVVWIKGDPKSITNLSLDTPYIIDKLRAYQTELDNCIKTLLGVDNQGGFLNNQQQNLDTTNSNNQEINTMRDAYLATIKDSFDRANKVCGLNLTVEVNAAPVEQESTSHSEGEHAKWGEQKDE